MSIEANVARIKSTIEAAARQSGREPAEVCLIGVSKTVERPAVDAAYDAGVRDFGENRVQDAKQKFAEPMPDDARLHLIGYLQTNKARDAVRLFNTIHSVDRPALIEELERRAAQLDKRVRVLIQVNIAGEEQKHGCDPEEVEGLVRTALGCPHLELRGLMTIAPLVEDAENTRPVFRALRELRDDLECRFPGVALPDLSMGMTNDYPIAVEEGATMVRIGRAVFA